MAEPLAPLLRRRALLGGNEETSSGTFVTPTDELASTAVYNASLNLADVYANGIRQPMGHYLATVMGAPGILAARLKFQTELAPGDKSLPMLTGCGYALGGGTYSPTSSMASRKTWSFALWQDGRLKYGFGMAGDMTLTLERGKPAMMEWEWLGKWGTNSAQVMPADASMPAMAPLVALPYVCSALTLTIGTVTPPRIHKAVIKLGANVIDLTGLGLGYSVVTSRLPTITIDMEARKKADLDTYGLVTAATEVAFSAALVRNTSTLTIAAPKAQRVEVTEGERDGVLLDELVFNCNSNAGDDELTFAEVTV